MKKYKLESKLKRHQRYVDAFSILSYLSYKSYISSFVTDTNLSANNYDDLNFFKDLLFESSYGNVLFDYYKSLACKLPETYLILSNYLYYIYRLNYYFFRDCINDMWSSCDILYLDLVFKHLDTSIQMQFIEIGISKYRDKYNLSSKMKLYALFS